MALPSALDELDRVVALLGERPAIFLDYDGTLTPIVSHPADARMGDRARRVLAEAADLAPVTIISGRDLDELRELVDVPGLVYSGNHGWEIEGPDFRYQHPQTDELRAELGAAERLLNEGTAGFDGIMVERKRFSLALHTRNARGEAAREAAAELAEYAGSKCELLRLTHGKEILELRAAEEWNKGTAISMVLDRLEEARIPIHVGDDQNDEDAFAAALARQGSGVVVGDPEGTRAQFRLADPAEVLVFLHRLTESLRKSLPVS